MTDSHLSDFTPRFPLGQLVITSGARKALSDEELILSISRHLRGDWGELGREDRKRNEEALEKGGRLFSAYQPGDTRFWIITEADRSATTILLPDEY